MDPNIETKSLERSEGWVNAYTVWSLGQARAFFLALSIYTEVKALYRLTMMLKKALPCALSDSVMRFLQKINKQGTVMDFPLGSVNVFLFLCRRVFWIWVHAEAPNRDGIVGEFLYSNSSSCTDQGPTGPLFYICLQVIVWWLFICKCLSTVQPEMNTRYQAKM